MAAAYYVWEVSQDGGNTLNLLWREKTTRVPRDLTSMTARCQVYSGTTLVLDLTDEEGDDGQILLGGTAGTISVVPTTAAAEALPTDVSLDYGLEVVDSLGIPHPLLRGPVVVEARRTVP